MGPYELIMKENIQGVVCICDLISLVLEISYIAFILELLC